MSLLSSLLPSGRPITAKTVHPGNAYLARVLLTRYTSGTNTFSPLLGANITCDFALDPNNTVPIAALQAIPLLEVGAAAPGVYAEIIPGASMNALNSLVGQTIYQLTRDAGGDVLTATALVVRYPRWAL